MEPGDRRSWRSVLWHLAFGVLGGYVILHPLSMLILAGAGATPRVGLALLAASFSAAHLPMGLYFALLGGVIGLLAGLSSLRLSRLYELAVHQSQADELTGLSNRRHLDVQLVREVARSKRHEQPLSALMIDIDGFKTFNDTNGHLRGDSVLRDLGYQIRASVRAIDVAARYGGDEFTVVLPETSLVEAAVVAERLRGDFARTHASGSPGLSLSVGVAEISAAPADARGLLQRADEALYAAKLCGGNCVRGVPGSGAAAD